MVTKVEQRPATLTAIHNYNLRNQGWPTSISVSNDIQGSNDHPNSPLDPVIYTHTRLGFYPSNADIIHQAKLSSAANVIPIGSYSPWELEKNSFGNTPAPKGHFIINAFDRNRQLPSGINGIYSPSRDTEDDRPSAVQFYAGRVWYLMPKGEVYFSQSMSDINRAGKCYQEQDPTAEDINELIDSDGGKIDITGMTKGYKMVPIRSELLLLGDNGVWSISGGPEQPFSATQQSLEKITDTGALGRDAVVSAEGEVYYWSQSGIYRLTVDPESGLIISQTLSATTIQTHYDSIPEIGRRSAKGYYDRPGKRIFWLYSDDVGYDGVNFRHKYNRTLVLDIITGAFYLHTYDITLAHISAFTTKSIGARNTDVLDVQTIALDQVVTGVGPDQVVVDDLSTGPDFNPPKLKILTFEETSTDIWQYVFSEFKDRTFVDFLTADATGVSYTSHLETGDDVVGDLIANKEANTAYLYFKSTETGFSGPPANLVFLNPSGCFLRAKWQWTDTVISGRWSDSKQVYRLPLWIPAGTEDTFDFGFDVVQSIEQLRGSGRGMRLRFDSETGKDFWILGWAIPYTGITAP